MAKEGRRSVLKGKSYQLPLNSLNTYEDIMFMRGDYTSVSRWPYVKTVASTVVYISSNPRSNTTLSLRSLTSNAQSQSQKQISSANNRRCELMRGSLLIHVEKSVPTHYVGFCRDLEAAAHDHLTGKVHGMTANAYHNKLPMVAKLIEWVNIGPLLEVTTAEVFCRVCSSHRLNKPLLLDSIHRWSVHYDSVFGH